MADLETVFFVNFPNVGRLIESGQAADITPYVDEIKTFPDYNSSIDLFKKDGKIYGLPTDGYGMGLVYNKEVFTKAGLDPNTPPKTWAEVRAAAKKIAELGPGYVGYGEYSGNNVGGWHFTASIYGRGGSVITPDGKKAAFNTPEGKAVLENLHQMWWVDNSMGSQLYIDWPALMKAMAGGKMGMMLGAPDASAFRRPTSWIRPNGLGWRTSVRSSKTRHSGLPGSTPHCSPCSPWCAGSGFPSSPRSC